MERKIHSNGELIIGKPYITHAAGKARINSDVIVNGDGKVVWFEVPEEYSKYLCAERGDGFLIGMLYTAIHSHYDLRCEIPIGEELLYNLNKCLIPAVVKSCPGLYAPKIMAEVDSSVIKSEGAVGTGISCGVDSLHAIASNMSEEYPSRKITHLVLCNVGSFSQHEGQYDYQRELASRFAREVGLAYVETNSNLHHAFPRSNLYAVKYSLGFAIYMLQKLWGTYLYASDGYDFRDCNLSEHAIENSSWMDALSAICFSTHSLSVVNVGLEMERIDKLREIVDYAPSWKYLHVCESNTGPNCGLCGKCLRTLTALEALGALERYRAVFDVDSYLKRKNANYWWLCDQQVSPFGDVMTRQTYELLKDKIPLWMKLGVRAKWKWRNLYDRLSRVKILRIIAGRDRRRGR